MCTVLLRFAPGQPWPLLLAAVRDEFVDRAWDPPGRHWDDRLVGGRDHTAGGTWLAVDPVGPAVAAVLNGVRLPPLPAGTRPTRGTLPLQALRGQTPEGGEHDGFHLLLGTPTEVRLWSWDGAELVDRSLPPGGHIVVNRGIGLADEPVAAHFLPLLHAAASPTTGQSTMDFWGDWATMLAGDGMDPAEPGALLVRRVYAGRTYGSTSASLVAVSGGGVRYDFSATPADPSQWLLVVPDPSVLD
jgi:hypothetical protein